MNLKKGQEKILLVNASILTGFGIFYIFSQNYEFLIYVAVVVFLLWSIVKTNNRVNYSNSTLWGLTIWNLMHMAGGSVPVGDAVLYKLILIPISETYEIFKYDQLAHMFGFCVATLLMYDIIKPILKPGLKHWTALTITLIAAGLGLGAVNEIVEFGATVILPETGVGGYLNTSLDLISNLIGSIIAIFIIRIRNKQPV